MENEIRSEENGKVAPGRNALVRVTVLIGIAILVNVFLAYLVRVFYHEPAYTDFCPESQVVESLPDRGSCLSVGGQWNEPDSSQQVPYEKRMVGYCNAQFTCSKDFQSAEALYSRNLFVVFVVAGVLLLLGSAFLTGSKTMSSGLSLGGVFALIFGALRYWSDMDDRLRVVVSGIALFALLAIAWKRFRDE